MRSRQQDRSAMPVSLTAVVVNWNTRELLARCLESLLSGAESEGAPFGAAPQTPDFAPDQIEIFVVDNASSDGSAQMVRERFPGVRLIENPKNVGFAAANNQALRRASGRFVLLLNSDAEVLPGAVQHLVSTLEGHPEAGAAGPRMLNPDGSLQNSYGILPSVLNEVLGPYRLDSVLKPWGRLGRRFRADSLGNWPRAVDRVSFACTLIRHSCLQELGLLDERFVFYS